MELTFGQKVVGLKFNHAEGVDFTRVDKAKQGFADIIDSIGDPSLDTVKRSWMYNILRTAAINACITAQMAVVKWITWND